MPDPYSGPPESTCVPHVQVLSFRLGRQLPEDLGGQVLSKAAMAEPLSLFLFIPRVSVSEAYDRICEERKDN